MSQVALVTGAAKATSATSSPGACMRPATRWSSPTSVWSWPPVPPQLDASSDTVLPLALDVMQKSAFEAATAADAHRALGRAAEWWSTTPPSRPPRR